MKKIAYFLLMSCFACLSVFALYDESVKVLRIFNGGVGTTIQLSHVDSLVFLPAVAHEQTGEMSVVYSLDSIYSISIGSIEYIKVDEVDMEEYQSNINSIEEYIEEHETQPVTVFQDNLISWLNQQDWVDKTVIDEGHNNITVIDKNGVPFYIYLQDMSFFDVPGGYQTKQFLPRRVTGIAKSVDVSHLENEQIIDRNQVLYFRGMDFPWLVETVIHEISGEEYSNITQICSQAPVKTELKKIEKSIEMFQKETDLSEYAVVIIGNTHGAGNGCFLVEDPSYGSLSQKGMCIYLNEGIEQGITNSSVFRISPYMLSKMAGSNYPIVYGNYCWSYGLSTKLRCPVVGYEPKSSFLYNCIYSSIYLEGLLDGHTHSNVVKSMAAYEFKGEIVVPRTNRTDSRLRFFSITTNEVMKSADSGIPLVTGKINGFQNLREEIIYYAYVFGKDEELNPSNITLKGKPITVSADGSFSYECSQAGIGKHQVVIGFNYADKYYYGAIKSFEIEGVKCPDNNHPHAIDLGLPSGTKWCCCNVGATAPEGYGGYYAWGETSEKSEYNWDTYAYGSWMDNCVNIGSDIAGTGYDAATVNMGAPWRMPSHNQQMELMNNCSRQRTSQNGVNGILLTGPNGGQIFLPFAGYHHDAIHGYIRYAGIQVWCWSSSLNPGYDGNAYDLMFSINYSMNYDGAPRFYGLSVRAVRP